ncbi:ABC transporter related protein [Xylanimonas cellulosilytica DSM 15894]|uniref:ABC transporter related protein n=1 Tax=Xylanimonas cellulosilytica (strain DSM 15894 / JCM 12276 / CECT 5975 / KCTC 9989 / LMG 20990 / NBRC 107835 / XIL07) TaxID=446471 RepID=D1BXX4_XYLCX|nr:ABC transporter ATP-binding protein [Xylanimonas cellulosilytica]ACZ31765.1 ABC transporter related protein [Xylanimonas cellulosilytica DSM 15894]
MAISPTTFESLELRGVGRSFGEQHALSGLDLTVKAGEFIALLGPSGCGKSTALNCLAGLLPLTHGQILLDGKRIDTLPSEKRGFGMVFQSYALFPHLTVEKNIAFGLQMRGVPKAQIKARVKEAIALVKLEQHATKLPGQLSGGQQQRVAIARAVVLEPSLVLMDEPLSNLDAKLRLDMRTEIRRLHQSLGLTTVYVTHDQEEALSLADRLVVLREGRVQQVGTPDDLYDHPRNWHVADFMGYRNLLRGTVLSASGGVARVDLGGFTLTGVPVGSLRDGDAVRVAVRPDDLVVAVGGEVRDGNDVEATVSTVEYHGREFAVSASTADGGTVHVRSAVAPEAGDRVRLTARAQRVLVFPEHLTSTTDDDDAADAAEAAKEQVPA